MFFWDDGAEQAVLPTASGVGRHVVPVLAIAGTLNVGGGLHVCYCCQRAPLHYHSDALGPVCSFANVLLAVGVKIVLDPFARVCVR